MIEVIVRKCDPSSISTRLLYFSFLFHLVPLFHLEELFMPPNCGLRGCWWGASLNLPIDCWWSAGLCHEVSTKQPGLSIARDVHVSDWEFICPSWSSSLQLFSSLLLSHSVCPSYQPSTTWRQGVATNMIVLARTLSTDCCTVLYLYSIQVVSHPYAHCPAPFTPKTPDRKSVV